jgi:hypothetical protein
MRIFEIIFNNEIFCEAKVVWARKGKSLVKKFRCTGGRRKGKLVSNPSQCGKPLDVKKSLVFKKTKSRMGSRMVRKSKATKKFNPASRRLRALRRR